MLVSFKPSQLILLAALFVGTPSSRTIAAEQVKETLHYAVSHDSEITRSFVDFDGQLVALEVQIAEIKNGPTGKPYMKANFSKKSGSIWLAALTDISGHIQVNDVVHVLGYVAKVDEDLQALVKTYNSTGYHLLPICYYNFRTSKGLFIPFKEEPNQCTQWRDGGVFK
jgi:hypothetical protein